MQVDSTHADSLSAEDDHSDDSNEIDAEISNLED